MEYKMIYGQGAEDWCDAMTLGSGRLVTMDYAQASVNRIQLNEDNSEDAYT